MKIMLLQPKRSLIMTHKQDTDRKLCELSAATRNAEWIAERQRERADKAEAALAAALAANRDCVDHFEQMKAEIEGLQKRVNDAPTGTLLVNYSHGQPISANVAADDGEALAAIDCRSVRIMVEE